MMFTKYIIPSPLGDLVTVCDEQRLYLLEFIDEINLENEKGFIKKQLNAPIKTGKNVIIEQLENELIEYFAGTLKKFKTPLQTLGTIFQNQVWQTLQKIPYGKTQSYQDIAISLGKSNACRAVGNANGRNHIVIVIPCHRIIQKNGDLGGYSSGLARKKWLLTHEQKYKY